MKYLMISKCAIVFYYTKYNRYSFNALLGALESKPDLKELPIYFNYKSAELILNLKELLELYKKVVLCISILIDQFFEIIQLINEIQLIYKDKDIIFIAGGPYPTGNFYTILKSGFKFVVVGEGEQK